MIGVQADISKEFTITNCTKTDLKLTALSGKKVLADFTGGSVD
jgi:hypothetical protein